MNKAKKLLSFRFNPSSLHSSSHLSGTTRLLNNQVTRSSHFTPVSSLTSIFYLQNSNQQQRLFSSKPNSFLELFSSEDWSKKLEKEPEASNLTLNHETVMYVLNKLSKNPKKASGFFKWVVKDKGFEPSSSIYSLMLRIYAQKEFLKEFWVLIEEMKEKGYFIDEETYRTIYSTFRGSKMLNETVALKHFYNRLVEEGCLKDSVEEVVGIIKEEEWGESVESKLGAMDITVTDNFVLRVFKELRKKGYPLRAHKFFKWVEKSLGFKHNTVTYNGMLRVLCWEESIAEFWSVLNEMKGVGFDLDVDTYIKVSRQLQKNKMFEDSVRLFEHMMDSQFKLSLPDCCFLLRAIANERTPDLDLVIRVVNKFEAEGNSSPKVIYDLIHRSLTALGMFDEAEEIIQRMKNAGFEPDNTTYSQLVFGLGKAGRFDDAYKVLDLMEEQGCAPDIKTWTILIKAHFEANELDKALMCFGKMMEKGFDPDSDLLDVLIYGFLKRKRTLGAYELLLELEKKIRLKPWQATFKNLIQKLLDERKLEEAMELLRLMKKHNYPPFSEPFVQYISESGTVDDALEFLKALSGKEFPSVYAYQHVFRSFFNQGRHSEANDLLFKCPHHIRKHKAIYSLFDSVS